MRALLGAAVVSCLLAAVGPAAALGFGPLESFGSLGEGAGEARLQGSVAVGPDGSLYLADFGNSRIDVFAPGGAFARSFGAGVNPLAGVPNPDLCTATSGCKKGTESGQAGAFAGPEAIVFDSSGQLYVADLLNNRIDVFRPGGTFVRAFGSGVNVDGTDTCTALTGCQSGGAGGLAGSMLDPTGLSFAPDGLLYVVDSGQNRIDVFTAAGEFVRAFGKEVNPDKSNVCTAATGCLVGAEGAGAGEMDSPWDVRSVAGGLLAVSDSGNNRIDVFTPGGEFVRAFGKGVVPAASGGGDVCTTSCRRGEFTTDAGATIAPRGIAVTGDGSLLVSDPGNNRVDEFSVSGTFLRAFGAGLVDEADTFEVCTAVTGCHGGRVEPFPGSTGEPFGVAVDCRGAIYVSEVIQARVERFGEPGTPSAPCPASQPAPPAPPSRIPPESPSNAFRIGQLHRNLEKGTGKLFVTVPGPGDLFLQGAGLLPVDRQPAAARTVRLPVIPTGKAKRRLLRHASATVRAKVTFTPTGGRARTKTKRLTLKAALGR